MSIHQGASKINELGGNAVLTPLAGTNQKVGAEEYKGFGLPEEEFEDNASTLVIVPEVYLSQAPPVKKATIAVWWLSWDNSAPAIFARQIREVVLFRGISRKQLRKAWRGTLQFLKLIWSRPNNVLHFANSFYASAKLRRYWGVVAHSLAAPTLLHSTASEFAVDLPLAEKGASNSIAYGVKRGSEELVLQLLARRPDLDWIPIRGLDYEETRSVLERVSLYVDFGTFPGRDRTPREAILLGTPVLLAARGAAACPQDFDLPKDYLVRLNSNWKSRALQVVDNAVKDSAGAFRDQINFFEQVSNQSSTFANQIERLFFETGAPALNDEQL